MRRRIDGRRQEQLALAEVSARLRVEEQRLREEAAGTFVAGRDEATEQQNEIARLERKLHVVHRKKVSKIEELRFLSAQKEKTAAPIPDDSLSRDSLEAASREDGPDQ
jgi:hypothetical protein